MKTRLGPRIWTTKTYDRLSPYYDVLMKRFFPVGEKAREIIAEKLIAGTVLDVACGTGTLLAMAHEKGLQCCGIDISEGMLSQAKQKVPADFQRASYYQLPYPGESFDYVVATNALSGTFIKADEVLAEMMRVCRTGGWIYVAEWPKASEDTVFERLLVWFASLNDDAPKDYVGIFRGMGYQPEVEFLSERFHVIGAQKV